MVALHSRSALFAGLLTAALFTPAWSADVAAEPEATGTEQVVAMAGSSASHAGPVVARESLASEASGQTMVVLGESQPTRSYGNPGVGKPHARTRGGVAYNRPTHRYSLMLGIGY
jgi:hypothetical protein